MIKASEIPRLQASRKGYHFPSVLASILFSSHAIETQTQKTNQYLWWEPPKKRRIKLTNSWIHAEHDDKVIFHWQQQQREKSAEIIYSHFYVCISKIHTPLPFIKLYKICMI